MNEMEGKYMLYGSCGCGVMSFEESIGKTIKSVYLQKSDTTGRR